MFLLLEVLLGGLIRRPVHSPSCICIVANGVWSVATDNAGLQELDTRPVPLHGIIKRRYPSRVMLDFLRHVR
jgi:hypothetical protein